MATRSRIAIENQDGTVQSIYCHWDGYVSGVGETLFNHYDREKLEKLIELGDISSLGTSLEPTDPNHTFENPQKGVTIAYSRDRGEDLNLTPFSNVPDLFDYGFESGVEYIYCLAKNGIWLVGKLGSSYVAILKEELEEEGV